MARVIEREQANAWLELQDEKRPRTNEQYRQGLLLVCALVDSPPFKVMKQTLNEALDASKEHYFAGKNSSFVPRFQDENAAALYKVSPHFCHPEILGPLQSKKYRGVPGAIVSKVKLLKSAGLRTDSPEFALLMVLSAITAGRKKQFEGIIEFLEKGTIENAPRLSLRDPHQFLLNFLKNSEFWRGFVDGGLEIRDNYLRENFGADSQKALRLWSMIWFARTAKLRTSLTTKAGIGYTNSSRILVPFNQMLQETAGLLLQRKWDKAEQIIRKIALEAPELFSPSDPAELQVSQTQSLCDKIIAEREQAKAQRGVQEEQARLLAGCLLDYLRTSPMTGTRAGKQVLIEITGGRVSEEKRGGRIIKLFEESTRGRYPFSKEIDGRWFHTSTVVAKTLLQRLESGEYQVPQWPEIKKQLMAQLLGQSS